VTNIHIFSTTPSALLPFNLNNGKILKFTPMTIDRGKGDITGGKACNGFTHRVNGGLGWYEPTILASFLLSLVRSRLGKDSLFL